MSFCRPSATGYNLSPPASLSYAIFFLPFPVHTNPPSSPQGPPQPRAPQSSSISFHLPPRAFQQSSFYSSLGAPSASPFRSPANTPQFSTYTTSFTPTRNGFSEPLGGEQRRQRLWKVLKSGWTSKSCRRCCGCANYSPCCGSRYCASLFSRSCCHWCHEDCSEPFCILVTVGGGALVITVWVFSRRMRTDPREP
jgi:hypothetical protein